MKRGTLPNGTEVFTFGTENSLKIFPPNTFKFKPKSHIALDNIQECILDNFWFQYCNKTSEKGYMLSILHSLAEYFNMMNKKKPIATNIETQEMVSLYVLYDGIKPGIYITYEEIIKEKLEARKRSEDLNWKKYADANVAISMARSILGDNYYIEPKAIEYIQKLSGIYENIPASPASKYAKTQSSRKGKEEESSKYQTYKSCLMEGVDPLDAEHIDLKIEEKMEEMRNIMKEEIKEVVLKELQVEFYEKFYKLKKDNEEKFEKLKKENDEKFEKFKKEDLEFKIDNFLNDDGKYDVNMEDSQLPE